MRHLCSTTIILVIRSTRIWIIHVKKLKRSGLATLEKGRIRGDLVKAYKIITGEEALQLESFFELAPMKAMAL